MVALRVFQLVDLVVGLIALGPASLRWLRVAQREHYLAGCAAGFARRWWLARPVNVVALFLAGVGVVVSTRWSPAGIASGLVCIAAPFGLGVRGRTSALAWTSRLRRVAACLVGLDALAIGVSAVVGGLRASAVAALALAVLAPGFVDAALALLTPLENRLALRYVDQARVVLKRLSPRVVAITGSYGKTSTKGYLAHLLSGSFSVLASPRSFNNRAGLARTVNQLLLPGTDVLIAEMGTYGPGEIAQMVEWLAPEVAVLTAIGPVHLERFRSLEAILSAKREIAVGAATVVINVEDPLLSGLADELAATGQRVIRCSSHDSQADVAVLDRGDEVVVDADGNEVGSVSLGAVRASIALGNLACALGAAIALGSSIDEMVPLLESLPVAENRLTSIVAASGAVIFDDTYNSNPRGTGLALEALAGAASEGRSVVVISPGMVELGPVQREENARFAAAVAKVATHFIIVGRTNQKALLSGVRDASLDGARCEVRLVNDREQAVKVVQAEFGAGDVVLYENDLPDHYA